MPCGNKSLRSNWIGCEGKFRHEPCHMNCYFVVKLFRSWLVLIAMPRWASDSISHGSWRALPCRQLWLQLPWPMCRRTVSLWIIHGLCSSLTQEHWRQQWIMYILIPALKHLLSWFVAKRKIQMVGLVAYSIALYFCGKYWISQIHNHMEINLFWFFSPKKCRILSVIHPLIMLTCSNQSYANRKVCCFERSKSQGKSRCEKWNGNWVYSMGSAAATLCRPSQRKP